MRRQLNVKLLCGLLVAGVALAGGGYALHRFQLQRQRETLLAQANRAETAGNAAETAEYLRLYLAIAPGDTDALARYGFLLDHLAATSAERGPVVRIFQTVFYREPDRSDIRRRLAQLALEFGHPDEARKHLLLLRAAHPEDGEVEYLLGKCHCAAGEDAAAAECFNKAILYAPQQIDSYVQLAEVWQRRHEEPEHIAKLMDSLVAANPETFRAYLVRARYRSAEGDRVHAGEDLARARALAGGNAEVLLESARWAVASGLRAEARAFLREGIKHDPKNLSLYQELTRQASEDGQGAEAIACLRQGLEHVSDQPDLLGALAEQLIAANEVKEAEEVIERLRRGKVGPGVVDYLQARVLMQQGQWRRAALLLDGLQERPDLTPEVASRVQGALGQCHGELADPEKQLGALRRAVERAPRGTAPRLQLAAVLLAAGRAEEAIQEYRELMLLPDAPPAVWSELARAVVVRTLRLPARERDWQPAEEALNEAARRTPGAVEVSVLRAEVLAAKGEFERARDRLRRSLEEYPTRIELWVTLALLEDRRGRPAQALDVLNEAEKRLGDRMELRLARAAHWAGRDSKEAVAALAKLERGLEEFTPPQRRRLLAALADTYARVGAGAEAERLWRQLAEQEPQDLQVRLLLFDAALRAGREAELATLVGEARRIEGGDGPVAHYCEAARLYLHARRGDRDALAAARQFLTGIAGGEKTWLPIALLQASLDEVEGDTGRALEHYLAAVERGERQPQVLRRVAHLLYERRRYTEADHVLRKLQEQDPLGGSLGRLGVVVALRAHHPERALELARREIPADSKDYRDYLWLGQVLWSVDRRDEAEAAFRRAVTLGGAAPEPWVVLVQFLVATKQTAQAEAALQAAQGKIGTKDLPLVLAQGYVALGKMPRAEEQFRAALASCPGDAAVLRAAAAFYQDRSQPRQAEPLLRQFLALKDTLSATEAAWGRRQLALVVADGGTYQQFRAALALLEENQQEKGGSAEDLRARALLLATRPGHRRQALAVLEELARRQALTPDEQFVLAQLYEADGNWPKSRERLEGLVAVERRQAAYLAFFARGLIRHREVSVAEHWLAQLETLQPQSFPAVEIRARLLLQQRLQQEALSLLKEYAGHDQDRLLAAAGLLEELGQNTAAEQLLRQRLAGSPKPAAALALAAFLGRRERVSEALELCDQASPTCPPETVARIATAVVTTPTATDKDRERVAARLEAALQQPNPPAECAFHLGLLRERQGRYEAAEALYRRAIAADPQHIAALNDLAWMLAQQEGKGQEALELVQRAFDRAGPLAALLDTRGVAYLRTSQPERAVPDLEAAIAEEPTAARYFHLAQAYQMAGNSDAAAVALQQGKARGLCADSLDPRERLVYQQWMDSPMSK